MYDKEAIGNLATRIARAELPKQCELKTSDFVIGYERKTNWYLCQFCGRAIQRSIEFSNRKFTCFDCRREKQKEYDNSDKRIQLRKERYLSNDAA